MPIEYGPWVYPEPIAMPLSFNYRRSVFETIHTDPNPLLDNVGAAGTHPPEFAGLQPPTYAASAFFKKNDVDAGPSTASMAHAARINVLPGSTPVADTGPPPEFATADHDGIGAYSGEWTYTVAWGVRGSSSAAGESMTGYLARVPGATPEESLPYLRHSGTPAEFAASVGSWDILDVKADTDTHMTSLSQNALWYSSDGPGAVTETTTTFDAATDYMPLGVFTGATVGGYAATPALALTGFSGWYAEGARITGVTVTRTYTPPRWRWVYDTPSHGVWRLRQRQSLTGVDGWALRQRQNGAGTGSWPLRQRQSAL